MTIAISTGKTLDLRSVPAADRPARARETLDALPPGDTLVLVSGDAAGDVLRHLQAERRGLFDWSPLQTRSGCWRIEICRRAGKPGALRAVTEALSWDHDRLDALEAAAFEKRAAGDLVAARDLYGEFALGLRRHIGFEEQLVFPAFEQRAGLPPTAGPTAVMRAEHREIEGLLDRIEAGIGEAAAPVEALRRSLHAVLGDHNLKEEQVLYPSTDDLLGEEEADRLVTQIQRLGG
ncbi:MAG: hemerythrin domain-containing protein [Acidobacteriota bacterium]